MRMQTLREQGYGAKAIVATYPLKTWKLSTVKKSCQRVDATGSATERKAAAVVDRNLRARSQTSNVLKSSFALKKDRAAST